MVSVNDIRKHVTHFSEEIRLKAKQSEEVTVGGFVTEQFKLSDDIHIVILDDLVGKTTVLMSTEMYDHFKPVIDPGQLLSIQGYVNTVSRKTKDGTEIDYSVVAFDLQVVTL